MYAGIKERKSALRKLAKAEDYAEIEHLIDGFQRAAEEKDRTGMQKLSKDALLLEKKYIPLMNREVAEKLGCDTLLMTVGFQKEPIILSILCLRPKRVFLLHTDGSRHVAHEVETDAEVGQVGATIFPTPITESDAARNYKVIRDDVLTKLPSSPGTILADPTAGRKVMVASLALVAFFYRLPMVYLHTIEVSGLAIPFMETLEEIKNPFEFFGDTDLALIEENFNSHFYDAAVRGCERLLETIRDPAAAMKVSLLKRLAEVYRDWDLFLHSQTPPDHSKKQPKPLLSERLKTIVKDCERFGMQCLLPEDFDKNLKFLEMLDRTWRSKRNIVDENRLIDIFCAAIRRAKQGKFDDAVARLYRCMEMCATLRLREFGLEDPTKPKYDKLATKCGLEQEELANQYRQIKERDLPRENLALDDQMALLQICGEKIAKIYAATKKEESGTESIMSKRNLSTLAHGTSPITENEWKEFRSKVEPIIRLTISEETFKTLTSLAEHKDIPLSGVPVRVY
jgi:CRISPR-associated protein (TIGR02710 family)